LLVAILAAAAVIWFLEQWWFPVVRSAIAQLPEEGEILDGKLDWSGISPTNLAENHYLGFSLDLTHSGNLERISQIQVEFGLSEARIRLLPGYTVIKYPAGWRMAFNRKELAPLWGAWEPMLAAGAALGTLLGLLISWHALATVYCGLVKLIALYANRDLTWWQAWKLSAAALLPGALFLTFGICVYGITAMSLAQLAVVWGLHLVAGWIYLVVSPMFLPRHGEAPRAGNPFDSKRPKPNG